MPDVLPSCGCRSPYCRGYLPSMMPTREWWPCYRFQELTKCRTEANRGAKSTAWAADTSEAACGKPIIAMFPGLPSLVKIGDFVLLPPRSGERSASTSPVQVLWIEEKHKNAKMVCRVARFAADYGMPNHLSVPAHTIYLTAQLTTVSLSQKANYPLAILAQETLGAANSV